MPSSPKNEASIDTVPAEIPEPPATYKSSSRAALVISIISLMASSCALVRPPGSSSSDGSSPLENYIERKTEVLQAQVSSLHSQVARQHSELERLRTFQNKAESVPLPGNQAAPVLDVSTKASVRIDTKIGFFLLSCQEVQSFLDGQKIDLDLGNPLGLTYVGFTIVIRWGPRYSGDVSNAIQYNNWFQSLKTIDRGYTENLEPFSWNRVSIVLPQTKPEDLGYVQIAIVPEVVALKKHRAPP